MDTIKKEDFDEIYKVINRLVKLSAFRGLAYGIMSFETKWEYRKNEYVFGATMKYEHHNLKIEDYTCVFFNDSDKNNSDKSDFTKMAEDISAFMNKVAKLDSDFKPVEFD